jgi:hypothetical protein
MAISPILNDTPKLEIRVRLSAPPLVAAVFMFS